MKPVVQEETTGCGIASVATLAGVSYREAQAVANRLGIYAQDERLWSDTEYVRKLLRHFGMVADPKELPFRSWETLPNLALLSIKWHIERGLPFWHWVVFWRGPRGAVVLDPKKSLKTNTRRDFGRMRPKWFIEIRHPQGRRIINSRKIISTGFFNTIQSHPKNDLSQSTQRSQRKIICNCR